MKLNIFSPLAKSFQLTFPTASAKTPSIVSPSVASVGTPLNPPVPSMSNAKVVAAVSSVAPDKSGKTMLQFGGIIGSGVGCFASNYEAEVACMEEARAQGCTNFMKVPGDLNSFRILAW